MHYFFSNPELRDPCLEKEKCFESVFAQGYQFPLWNLPGHVSTEKCTISVRSSSSFCFVVLLFLLLLLLFLLLLLSFFSFFRFSFVVSFFLFLSFDVWPQTKSRTGAARKQSESGEQKH